jgi:cell division protein ZapA
MPKLMVTLYGRDYPLSCAAGEEQRVRELAVILDQKMRDVAEHTGNATEVRLFMLAALMLADEVLELRAKRVNPAIVAAQSAQEDAMLGMINQLQNRLEHLTNRIGTA